jgi:hypothetical protein
LIKVITYVAYRCGDLLASPWAIVFFAFVSLTALPQTLVQAVAHGDIAGLVGWFSQNFVQLVSLAVLAFIADRQGRAAQVRGDEMYGWLSELHTSLLGLHGKADALHEKVDAATGADR